MAEQLAACGCVLPKSSGVQQSAGLASHIGTSEVAACGQVRLIIQQCHGGVWIWHYDDLGVHGEVIQRSRALEQAAGRLAAASWVNSRHGLGVGNQDGVIRARVKAASRVAASCGVKAIDPAILHLVDVVDRAVVEAASHGDAAG